MAFLNQVVRAVEPYLKAFSYRLTSPWKGNHIVYGDLNKAVVPWGFVTQQKVLENVTPDRSDGNVEKRAEHLNLDTWEFLRGTEEAYRCVAGLFAPSSSVAAAGAAGAAAAPVAVGDSRSQANGSDEESTAGVVERDRACGGGGAADGREQGAEGAPRGGDGVVEAAEERGLPQERSPGKTTDFLDLDVASPQMSMFLNDVLESYRVQRLVPRLTVNSVEAKLCNVGIRLGGISKNTNFLGLMSADEVKYHLTMGMLGPEGDVINELEGRAPQKVIADVRLTCEEEFVLEDESGKVVHGPESAGQKVHYLTLQSNVGDGTALEWQITNINDVIKPNLAYYFSRFGH